VAPGVSLDNIQPQEGYFLPLNGDGTEFYTCLNDACEETGSCVTGYSGLGMYNPDNPEVI